MQYNDAQLAAIDAFTGPAMVVAGPGSGKTAVITRRTARLIERGVPPENILVVTFTRAAAEEMEGRFLKMGIRGGNKVTFGTFHSVFFKILRFAYNLNSSNILKTTEAMKIVRHICDSFRVDTGGNGELLSDIHSEICKVKSLGVDVSSFCATTMEPDVFRRIYYAYDKEVKRSRLYDFEDILTETYRLLASRRDILVQWQEKYEFIMVDEFQDINKVQYETIKLLAGDRANLFVVGDDDQSIYGFRGSDPMIMAQFNKDYSSAALIKLSVNHRSGKEIVETAGRLIAHNSGRFSKAITAFRNDSMPIRTEVFENSREEAAYVVDKIKEFHGRGVPYREMAVLARNAEGLNSVVKECSVFGVPFVMKDYFPCLYNHFVAKDIISFIRLSVGLGNQEDMARVRNKYEKINDPEYTLKFISRCTPKAAVVYIRRAAGYENYLVRYATARGQRPEELLDKLEQLLEDTNGYRCHEEWLNHVRKVREEIRSVSEEGKRQKGDEVSLGTMHGSKGLEFQVVFIIGVNDGVIPHKKCITKMAVEEERRLFYVAVTRAKSRLFISSVRKRYGKDCEDSPFLREIQE